MITRYIDTINGMDNYTEFCLVMVGLYVSFALVGMGIGVVNIIREMK